MRWWLESSIRWDAAHWSTCSTIISFSNCDLRTSIRVQTDDECVCACGTLLHRWIKQQIHNQTNKKILSIFSRFPSNLPHSSKYTAEKTAVNKIIHFFSISKKEKWIWLFCVSSSSGVGVLLHFYFLFTVIELCRGLNTMIDGKECDRRGRILFSFIVHWYSCMQLDKNENRNDDIKSLNFDSNHST